MAASKQTLLVIAWVVVPVLLLLAALGGSYALAEYAISASQRNWCSALDILTAKPIGKPADPAANPSRVATYEFYVSLKQLEVRFGC